MKHYVSCSEVADIFDVERENVHFATSLKTFRELLISKRYEIVAPRAYNSRIFVDIYNNIYFYNGVTIEEVDELLTETQRKFPRLNVR